MPLKGNDSVVQCAAEYLALQRIAYARCLGATKLPVAQFGLWESLFNGRVHEIVGLWQVDFEKRILPPETVNTGNSFSVFVESSTGTCAVYWSM